MNIYLKKFIKHVILLVLVVFMVSLIFISIVFEKNNYFRKSEPLIQYKENSSINNVLPVTTKYIQPLNSRNAKCFLSKPKDTGLTCFSLDCDTPNDGYYYDSETDTCHYIRVNNIASPSVPFNSMYDCEITCRTMLYSRLNDNYLKIDKSIYYIPTISLIYGVDVNSFIVLGDHFVKDKNNIYFTDQKIKLADQKSFQVLSKYYSKDNNYIFYKSEIIEEADNESFEVLINNDNTMVCAEDKKNFYINTKERTAYAKDKNYIYNDASILIVVDRDSFQVVSCGNNRPQEKEKVYISENRIWSP